MCLITLKYDTEADYPFLFIGNRDEEYLRPSVAAHFWSDQPNLLAGRDLKGMGTWLGLTRNGRFATLLNHPFTSWQPIEPPLTRGKLVSDFLTSDISIEDYTVFLRENRNNYEGYQIIYGDMSKLVYYSSVRDEVINIPEKTIFSVSNTRDDLSLNRVNHSVNLFENNIANPSDFDLNSLLEILQNKKTAEKMEEFPELLSREEALRNSSIFIAGENFGTVASTAIMLNKEGQYALKEIRHSPSGPIESTEKKFSKS